MKIREFTIAESKIKWIDIENPNHNDLTDFCETHNLSQASIQDCLEPDHLPKYEELTPLDFILTRALHLENEHSHTIQEMSTKVAIFINSELIITVHRLSHSFLEDIIHHYVNTKKIHSTHELATKIIKGVLRTYEKYQNKLAAEIDAIEDLIFLKNTKKSFTESLYYLKRQSTIGKKQLLLTREVLNGMKTHHKMSLDLRDVIDLHGKLEMFYDQLIDDVSNLLTIYLSVASQKTNDVMKVLTVFSVFFMPLTFIVGIYGMNFQFMPELSQKYGYMGVWIAMITVSIVVGFWFKRKKWL
jgi:magnesium transporter